MPPTLMHDNGDHYVYMDDSGNLMAVSKSQIDPDAAQADLMPPSQPLPTPVPASVLPPPPPPAPAAPESTDPAEKYFTNGTFDTQKYIQTAPDVSAIQKRTEQLQNENDQRYSGDNTAIDQAVEKSNAQDAYNEQRLRAGLPVPSEPTPSVGDAISKGTSSGKPTTGAPVPTTPSAGLSSGFADQRQAAIDSARIGQKKADEVYEFQKKQAENMETYNQQQAQKFNDQQLHVKMEMQKYNALAQDYRNTSIRDPWADASTGTRIQAAIAIGLGALGSSIDGSHTNQALQMINDAVARDINLQKMNLDKKRGSVDMQNNIVAQTRQMFSDANQQDAALHALALEKVQMDLKNIAAKYDSQQIGANLRDIQGKLKVQESQLGQQYIAGALDNYVKLNSLNHPAVTAEQARSLGDAKKLNDAADAFMSLQKAPSRIGNIVGTNQAALVQSANAKAYEALYNKPAAGKEFEAWAATEGLNPHDVGNTQLLEDKVSRLREEAQIRRLGAGRAGQTYGGTP